MLGAGAWGTAIASVLAPRLEVTLWARDPAQAESMARLRRNERYLPGVEIPAAVKVSADFPQDADLMLAATPVAGLREIVARLKKNAALVWLCKGFEEGTGALPHQVVEPVVSRCGALSGPSFAAEVARGLPCALTLAARDAEFAREAAALLHGGRMRVYYSADLIGVEIGGAVKNVMAIAAGISDGLGLGANARAALITRGLAEIARLGVAMGASTETIFGLTGVGDLIRPATCRATAAWGCSSPGANRSRRFLAISAMSPRASIQRARWQNWRRRGRWRCRSATRSMRCCKESSRPRRRWSSSSRAIPNRSASGRAYGQER